MELRSLDRTAVSAEFVTGLNGATRLIIDGTIVGTDDVVVYATEGVARFWNREDSYRLEPYYDECVFIIERGGVPRSGPKIQDIYYLGDVTPADRDRLYETGFLHDRRSPQLSGWPDTCPVCSALSAVLQTGVTVTFRRASETSSRMTMDSTRGSMTGTDA